MTTMQKTAHDQIIQVVEKLALAEKSIDQTELLNILKKLKSIYPNHIFIDNLMTCLNELKSNKNNKKVLTPREEDIIQLIGEGLQNKTIAEQLSLSKATVETHRKNIRKKLKLNGNDHLFAYAFIYYAIS